MKMLALAKRNTKEILRDPINLFFGLGFPIVLLLLLCAIGKNAPVEVFKIESLAPGITVFSLSFITLFSATLISKDRGSALFQRLYTTPLTAADFILAYALPLIPLSLIQSTVCYAFAMMLGLAPTLDILLAILVILPISIFYIALGLLFGSILTDKQAGGICGAMLTNLSAWLSGTWFELDLLGSTLKKIAELLPFVHATELERAIVSGTTVGVVENLVWILSYSLVTLTLAALVFTNRTKKQ